MKLFLVGFMGSGKSTTGVVLARKLGCEFVDLDQYLVQQEAMTVEQIFETHGEQYFRQCEAKYLRQIGRMEGSMVVSTGGGTPCKGDNMSYMRSVGVVVYLKLDPAMLRDRLLASKTVRPLIVGKDAQQLLQFIQECLSDREEYYLQANFVVANLGRDVDKIIQLINYKLE